MAKRNRNAPCECGSGKKFKRCCGRVEQRDSRRLATIFGVAVLVLAVAAVGLVVRSVATGEITADPPNYDAANNRYWHEEHGHWHQGRPPDEGATGEPWEYDAAQDRHWDPNHAHWHEGPAPLDRLTQPDESPIE